MSIFDNINNSSSNSNREYAQFTADGDTWTKCRVVQSMVINVPQQKDPSKTDLAVVFVIEGDGHMSDGSTAPARFRTAPMTLKVGTDEKPSNLSKFAKSIGYDGDCIKMVTEAMTPETANQSYLFSTTLAVRFDTIEGSRGGKFVKMDKVKASADEVPVDGYDDQYAPTNVEKKVVIAKGGRQDAKVELRAWVADGLVTVKEY